MHSTYTILSINKKLDVKSTELIHYLHYVQHERKYTNHK